MLWRVFGGGLVIGLIIAAILYFFVLEIPADAAQAAEAETAAGTAPKLAFPADCTIGQDCWYMAYVDLDSRDSYRDYMCGIRTYDAHKGTDIAPNRNLARRIAVRAAAPGRVVGTRDGMIDTPMRSPEPGRDAARCGNGVRVDHGGGWISQYCHLAKGSVAVRTGADVEIGQKLGEIGSSGWSELPHLHFQLEKDGAPVDPFISSGPRNAGDCNVPREVHAQWLDTASHNLNDYSATWIVRTGLTTTVPDGETAKFDGYPDTGAVDADVLVAYVVLFGAPEGVVIETEIDGPAGEKVFDGRRVIAEGRAEYFSYGGVKRKVPQWPPGLYTARVEVSGTGPDGPFRFSERADLILR